MMKSFSYLGRALFLALTIVLISSMVVSAAPLHAATTKSLSTSFTLVNLGSTEASVSVDYRKTDGSTWSASTQNTQFPVAKDFGQVVIAQYFDSVLSSGKGSAIVSSSSPLGAVVQILARNQTASSGAYSGISVPSAKYYAPLVQAKKSTASGVSSAQIMIQNVEATPQTVTVDFVGSGTNPNYTTPGIVIPGSSTYYYDLADEPNLNNWTGSATINAETGKKVAVIVNLFAGPNTLTTYNAFPDENKGTTWAVPQFVSRLASNSLSTPLSVQNLSASTMAAHSITATCVSSATTFTMDNATDVAAMQGYSFNPVTDTSIPANFSGACTLTAPGDVVVIATLRRPGLSDDSSAYEAFNKTKSTATKVVFPLMSKRLTNGFATNATVMNLSDVEANVKLTYTPSATYKGSQTPIIFTAKIAAGGNLYQNMRLATGLGADIPDGWFGTLLVESTDTTPAPLVGYVQLTNIKLLPGDNSMAHDAFTLP